MTVADHRPCVVCGKPIKRRQRQRYCTRSCREEDLRAGPGDEFADLFPGTGAVGEAWRAYERRPRIRYGKLGVGDQLPLESS